MALGRIAAGDASGLVAAKLDRLSRSVLQALLNQAPLGALSTPVPNDARGHRLPAPLAAPARRSWRCPNKECIY